MNKQVWFVTGASKGLGLSLAKTLISKGYRVAATSRRREDLVSAIGETSARFLPIGLDILDETAVQRAITATVGHFGTIGVVVNNAGYGLVGAVEELTDAEARSNFDVNVFGSLNVIRQALPFLRKQGSGHIFNIASIGGFTGAFPAFGIYCATKFAMHGYSEALAQEVKPFGIGVTIVSPGYFRTDFLGGSLGLPATEMPEYANVRAMQTLHQQDYNGNQPGDPAKAAEVMIRILEEQKAPLHLFLGADANQLAEQKLASLAREIEALKPLAAATGFDN
ncbi:SDR family NAD(P)-dependent oxidoreductase [Chitinophaga sp.]|uniref:SDR family NAD(P)-dependent oxidoreductase n=1 Tax=Chitinophaga sp. TaxID=1869181 RepID=UPI0026141970|nr:SDR family NAD(P)-dependent oxidoreductase [uncultured Chitinophaga sp.]